jgi:hypothetical protein
MQTADAKNQNFFITTIRLPVDLRDWLRQRADYFGGSQNTEIVRCCREVMAHERGAKGQAASATE